MKITVLGAGNMANAIVRAATKNKKNNGVEFYAYDKSAEQLRRIELNGANTTNNLEFAVTVADYILFSVKPQDLDVLISDLKYTGVDLSSKKYITICAGISTDYICNAIGCRVPVIRVMPNAPMMIGYGATAISRNELVIDKEYSKICGVFACGGEVSSIPEVQMNSIIAVNSSSPAFFYEFIRIMIDYATEQGIDEKVARSLAQNAMLGAAKMLITSEDSPEKLISIVKSHKGTTEAALDSFSENGLKSVIFDAMDACTKRAGELGK